MNNNPRIREAPTGSVVQLIVYTLFSLSLFRTPETSDPGQSFATDDEDGGDKRLSMSEEAFPTGLLVLGRIQVQDVVFALHPFTIGQHDDGLCVRIQLVCGLRDNRESLINLGQSLVSNLVGLLHIWRDIFIGPREIGNDGGGKGFVCRIAELERSLA